MMIRKISSTSSMSLMMSRGCSGATINLSRHIFNTTNAMGDKLPGKIYFGPSWSANNLKVAEILSSHSKQGLSADEDDSGAMDGFENG